LGHWVVEPVPVCGCDAYDETAEQEEARFESMVADLTTGRLTASIRLRLWGDGRWSRERLTPMRHRGSAGPGLER
jgi:hypothetical protein